MSANLDFYDTLRLLHPQVTTIRGDKAYDISDNEVEYDLVSVQAEVQKQEAAQQKAYDSALAKLKKLGLTDDEISALKGTL